MALTEKYKLMLKKKFKKPTESYTYMVKLIYLTYILLTDQLMVKGGRLAVVGFECTTFVLPLPVFLMYTSFWNITTWASAELKGWPWWRKLKSVYY